jgi:hypothetical protein
VDPWGLRHYTLEETNIILLTARAEPYIPLRHGVTPGRFGDYGDPPPWALIGWDFLKSDHTFTVCKGGREVTMRGSQFGNYLAGYGLTYHYGALGYLEARAAGNYYANTSGWLFWGDDPDSIRDINSGTVAGLKARLTTSPLTDLVELVRYLWWNH